MPARSSYPLAVALELTELGRQLRAQRHRREFPDASEDEVQAVVRAWMLERPGAPHGDASGDPSLQPRPS